jgi:hypothetical protein
MDLKIRLIPVFLVFVLNQALPQNFQEEQKLNSPNRLPGPGYGSSVAISGNTALVGSPYENTEGAVFVYEKVGSEWIEQQKIVDTDADLTFDNFGDAVAISGNYAVVGAPLEDGGTLGAAYVLERNSSGTWSIIQKINNPGSIDSDPISFGMSVDIDGDYLIVGSLFSAHIYERLSSGDWVLANSYRPDEDELASLGYGWSVGLAGSQAMVAAYSEEPGGAIYVLERTSDSNWTLHQKLVNSVENSFGMGWKLAMDDEYAVATTSTEVVDPCKAAIFMEKGDDGFWHFTQRIDGCDVDQGIAAFFGNVGLAVDGNTVLIGSDANPAGGLIGVVYVVRKSDSNIWEIEQEITESSLGAADAIGTSIGLDGNYAIIGTPSASETINGLQLDGVAYIYSTDVSTDDSSYSPIHTEIGLSPNPADDQLFVSFSLAQPELVHVCLFDITGRMIRKISRSLPAEDHVLTVSTQGIDSGVYILSARGVGWTSVKKIIIE